MVDFKLASIPFWIKDFSRKKYSLAKYDWDSDEIHKHTMQLHTHVLKSFILIIHVHFEITITSSRHTNTLNSTRKFVSISPYIYRIYFRTIVVTCIVSYLNYMQLPHFIIFCSSVSMLKTVDGTEACAKFSLQMNKKIMLSLSIINWAQE